MLFLSYFFIFWLLVDIFFFKWNDRTIEIEWLKSAKVKHKIEEHSNIANKEAHKTTNLLKW